VEKIRAVLASQRIIADYLKPSDTNVSDATVCRMHHETAARCPLIYITGNNLHRWSLASANRLSFGKPSTDEHVQSFEFGRSAQCVRNTPGRHASRFP
jgi:hypothetical protein